MLKFSGGWNAGSGKYSLMAKDDIKRTTFIASVVPFAREYAFEGIDFDWEYPGSREGTDADMDILSYNILIDEMKTALEPYGMLLTAALSPGKGTIDIAYDVPYIMERLDFANIMCYDYHGWFPDH